MTLGQLPVAFLTGEGHLSPPQRLSFQVEDSVSLGWLGLRGGGVFDPPGKF